MTIEVHYDLSRQTFKLVDQKFRTLLEGDALFDLALPDMFDEAIIIDSSLLERYAHENPGIRKS
jgi:hypothetical protein